MAEAMGEPAPRAYFDTPERAERLQLVAHVIRNTASVPYVRGPEGAGKTRFAERLAAIFKQETALVSLSGGEVADIPQAVCDALGISTDRWPAAAVDATPEDGLLVLVDDVDRLTITALEALQELREVGAKLLFLGESDPVALSIGWELQLIDLPPFSEAQLKDFLAFIGRDEASQPKGGALSKLLRNSQGQPGQVLALLAEGELAKPAATGGKGLKPGRWLAGGALVVVVALVLWQQERINALFEPPAFEMPQVASEPERAEAQPEIVAEPPPAVEPEPLVTAEPQPQSEPVVVEAPPAVAPVEAPMPEEVPTPAAAVDEAPVAEMPAEGVAEGVSPVAEPVGAEAAAEDAAAEQPEVQAEPPAVAEVVPEAEVAPEPQAEPEPEPGTIAWLRSRNPKALTLQLVGARDRAAIDQFIAEHQLTGDYAVYERDLGGKPWFSLVYGDFPDFRAAKEARSRLPKALHNAWPRSFESVMKQLPPE